MVTAAPSVMAKKKPAPKQDQHTSNFFLRLPEEYRAILQAMHAKTGRPMTVSAQVAIERLARDLGISFTPNWPELL